MNKLELKTVKISDLKPHPKNPRIHPESAVNKLVASIQEYGWTNPVLVSKDGHVLAGHARLKAAEKAGLAEVPCIELPLSGTKALAYLIADNRLHEDTSWDYPALENLFVELKDLNYDLNLTGFDKWEINKIDFDANYNLSESSPLYEKYLIPPMSVFDTKQKQWQDKKQYWLNKGIQGELGRKEGLLSYGTMMDTINSGTSIFDPFLCEIVYEWFCPPNGKILDPFAGGSVRGIIASYVNRFYTGIDLRKEQVEANIKQLKSLNIEKHVPRYFAGSSLNVLPKINESFDFLFSCPPYFDLEKYSNDKDDLSNKNLEEFYKDYNKIIKLSCDKVKDDSFACLVVSEVRNGKDKNGLYINLVCKTIEFFKENSFNFYNDIVLLNSYGTAALRSQLAFNSGRKICKVHQNVLVFLKGDCKKAILKLKSYKDKGDNKHENETEDYGINGKNV